MSTRRFLALLRGLSGDATYRYVTRKEAPEVTGEAARSVIASM